MHFGETSHGRRCGWLSRFRWVLCGALMAGGVAVCAARAGSAQVPIEAFGAPELDAGFHFLYEWKPEEAHRQFESWEKSHPEDPVGSASDAAAYLFEECYRQGVLTSAFFLDDKRSLGSIPLKPDPELRAAFFAADQRAQDLAQVRLKTQPGDPNALFAMALSEGMLNRVSAVVRAYDPCLSCSTHASGLLAMRIQLVDSAGNILDELVTD